MSALFCKTGNIFDMYRTHTCGELRIADVGKTVTLAGWVQKSRKLGGMTFIDLRDRYGITQLTVDAAADTALVETAASLGREYVIQAAGTVVAAMGLGWDGAAQEEGVLRP